MECGRWSGSSRAQETATRVHPHPAWMGGTLADGSAAASRHALQGTPVETHSNPAPSVTDSITPEVVTAERKLADATLRLVGPPAAKHPGGRRLTVPQALTGVAQSPVDG